MGLEGQSMDLVLTKVKEGEASNGPWFSGLWTWVASGTILGLAPEWIRGGKPRLQGPLRLPGTTEGSHSC